MLDRRGGDLQPLSYARGLARATIAAGVAIHGQTPATSLRREGRRWRVETPRAVVRAEKVLIATNGFTDDLWPGLRRTIVPVFSSIAATEPLPDDVARHMMPTRSVLYESGHNHGLLSHRYVEPLAAGWPRPNAMDSGTIRGRLSYALRWPALAGASRRSLDARLEQPPRHGGRSVPACARTWMRRADLSRLQWPWGRARDRHGKAIGEAANRGRDGQGSQH
jgi:hypothetical protein